MIGKRRYRIILVLFAILLMGASNWPSGCNSPGSNSTSGEVLIAGGENSSGTILDDGELYNPATEAFTSVSSTMSDGRALQTATLLQNGNVLIAGGINNGGSVIDSADLYNPSSGEFTGTGSMIDSRYQFAATRLESGEVLITGGLTNPNATSGLYTADLYNPSSGKFTTAGDMIDVRSGHTSTLLKNGDVLVVGGIAAAGYSFAGAELYNPSTNTFSATGNLSDGRAFQTATRLCNRRGSCCGRSGP